ncbi:MAG: hypothetical protein P4N41_24520 [Negativicutes bacterium]|nr:hypothetical protein [Negativicutes bacterium]MDR3592836.1 hypothetical protein [Negativicutes bacterium]
MMATVLGLWFAAAAVIGFVVGSYDGVSAKALIACIGGGMWLFFVLLKYQQWDVEVEIGRRDLVDWPNENDEYERRVGKYQA